MSVIFYTFLRGPNFDAVYKDGESQCIMYFYSHRFLDPSWFIVLFKILDSDQILLDFLSIFSFSYDFYKRDI